jgi:hypothetical protein
VFPVFQPATVIDLINAPEFKKVAFVEFFYLQIIRNREQETKPGNEIFPQERETR